MRIFQTLAAIALLAWAPLARAQQAMSECASLGPNIFCTADLTELDKAAKLSPAQKESIESLMREALARTRPIWTTFTEDWQRKGEDIYALAYSDPEKYQEASTKHYAEYWKASLVINRQISAVERETLGDIRSVLTADQDQHAWSAFERARRRLLLCNGEYFNLGRNPRLFVEKSHLRPPDLAAAEDILAKYELDLDRFLIERMTGLQRAQKEAEQKGEPDRNLLSRTDLASDAIWKLNLRTASSIEKALSDDGRQAFLRQRVGIELKDSMFTRPSADDRIKSIRKLPSLAQDQKSAADELAATADAAMFQLAIKQLREMDEAALRDRPANPEPQPEQIKEQQRVYGEQVRKTQAITTTLVRSLRALLSPSQRDELDYGALAPGGDAFKLPRERIEESEWADPKATVAPPAPEERGRRP